MPAWTTELRDACRRIAQIAMDEDVRHGIDCTSHALIDSNVKSSATFVSRKPGIVCGVRAAGEILQQLAPQLTLTTHIEDGSAVQPGDRIASIAGTARDILGSERIALNLMGRLSGISSLTRKYVDCVSGTQAKVYDTRKTTPGLRLLEKYAVACGGGENHRMGLFDAILIKDNHLALSREIHRGRDDTLAKAIQMARDWIDKNQDRLPHGRKTILQIEIDTLKQLEQALPAKPDIVLLDNMNVEQLREGVRLRNDTAPSVSLEASGGVTLETIGAIATTGVERISVGALTHSAVNFDIGLDWRNLNDN